MRNEQLDHILAQARPRIAKHWSGCINAGLYSLEETLPVNAAIESYFTNLKVLPDPAAESAILAEMKALFEGLDGANQDADGRLLETDERELLVNIIIDAAAAAGLDIDQFENGDPTYQFRNF
jgi:hypothetical protein